MKIDERKVTIREITENYINDDEEGVTGYNDNLDIRPKYQREFIYDNKHRDEVIRTVLKGLPLNVMYWVDRGAEYEDDPDMPRYEVMDGQQRTISICEYVDGNFSVDDKYFHNLPEDIQNKILDYKLFVYVCSGTESEKLEWFKIINIAGLQLTDQEMRNAVYAGSWTASAKKYFSRTNSPAYQVGGDYLSGSAIRQDYLETALKWICDRDKCTIEQYMGKHENDANAIQLWNYFRSVIDWVQATFKTYRREMKGLPWGIYYNKNKDRTDLNADKLEKRVSALMEDDDVTHKAGVYEYLLDGNERALSIRAFSRRDARAAYERQNGICPMCGKHFEIEQMQADHIVPWSKGGKTIAENCQMLCTDCNRRKSNI